jgi:hypothetical protein
MTFHIFPRSPQDMHCSNYNRKVVFVVNPVKPCIESEYGDANCQIGHESDYQSEGSDSTLVCFQEEYLDA